ncbi:Stp1/IreP family PP2C-type Ser/Thr phosphatase [Enterococcus sp. LJL120]
MEIRFQSDVGKRRKMNQDAANVFENQVGLPLAILADGMGGHLAGDVASQMIVTEVGSAWQENASLTVKEITEWLTENIQAVNHRIYDIGELQPEYDGMGSTAVMAVILEEQYIIANVGDSRAYLLRNQEISQISDDHSLVNELVKSGEITPEMAEKHPNKNILTRTVGMPNQIAVDIFVDQWRTDDYLLLCSDGLTNMVSEAEIAAIVFQEKSLADKVEQLVAAANEAGGADNITVLIIQLKEDNQ